MYHLIFSVKDRTDYCTVDCFRVYHVLLVLSSIAVGIVIIAIIVLIVVMFTKSKKRGMFMYHLFSGMSDFFKTVSVYSVFLSALAFQCSSP